eukprot:m.161245 g.161245  ORF g.161245 m.161245 type:complete len:1032 (-) comp16521_c0_seq2:78-3173(-)
MEDNGASSTAMSVDQVMQQLQALSQAQGVPMVDLVGNWQGQHGSGLDDDAADQPDPCEHAICNDPFFSSHVDQHITKKLLKGLCRNGHCVLDLDFRKDNQNLVCLQGHVQSGKTNSFTMLSLVLFLKYNLGILALLLNNAAVYSEYEHTLDAFNADLVGYGLTEDEAAAISIELSTKSGPTGGLTESQLVKSKPAIYGRLLTPDNLLRAVGKAMQFIPKCGVDDEGYINVALIVDEAHNTTASQNRDKFKLERAMHQFDMKSSLRGTMKAYLQVCYRTPDDQAADDARINEILGKIDQRGWQVNKLFKTIVHVTATTTPIAFTSTGAERLQVLKIKLPDDYVGFDTSVPLERRVTMKAEPHEEQDRRLPKLITKYRWVLRRMDEYVRSPDFQHVLLYAPGRNEDRLALAEFQAHRYGEVPFVALCLYGTHRGYGASMIFSKGAASIANKIAAADAALNCNRSDLHVSVHPPFRKGSQLLTNDASKRCFRPPWGGHLLDAACSGKALVDISDGPGVSKVFFVSSILYRDRALYNILDKACELAGVQLNQVKIAGIGLQLMREGVTLKTQDHRLAPTAMFYANPVTDDVKTIQATGRIAGRQQEGASLPALHAEQEVLAKLQKAYERLRLSNKAMEDGYREDKPASTMLALQPAAPELAEGKVFNNNFTGPAISSLLAFQSQTAPALHFQQAEETRARFLEQVAGYCWPGVTKSAVSAVYSSLKPDNDDHCCPEHESIDKWFHCETCLKPIVSRAIVLHKLVKGTAALDKFNRLAVAVAWYANAAGLSAVNGWVLQCEGTQPAWYNVALVADESKALSVIGKLQDGHPTPLRWCSGRWAVPEAWLDTIKIDQLSVTFEQVESCFLQPADQARLTAWREAHPLKPVAVLPVQPPAQLDCTVLPAPLAKREHEGRSVPSPSLPCGADAHYRKQSLTLRYPSADAISMQAPLGERVPAAVDQDLHLSTLPAAQQDPRASATQPSLPGATDALSRRHPGVPAPSTRTPLGKRGPSSDGALGQSSPQRAAKRALGCDW